MSEYLTRLFQNLNRLNVSMDINLLTSTKNRGFLEIIKKITIKTNREKKNQLRLF